MYTIHIKQMINNNNNKQYESLQQLGHFPIPNLQKRRHSLQVVVKDHEDIDVP